LFLVVALAIFLDILGVLLLSPFTILIGNSTVLLVFRFRVEVVKVCD